MSIGLAIALVALSACTSSVIPGGSGRGGSATPSRFELLSLLGEGAAPDARKRARRLDLPHRSIDALVDYLGEGAQTTSCEEVGVNFRLTVPEYLPVRESLSKWWRAEEFALIARQEFNKGNYAGSVAYARAAAEAMPGGLDDYCACEEAARIRDPGYNPRMAPGARTRAIERDLRKANTYMMLARYHAFTGEFEAATGAVDAARALRSQRKHVDPTDLRSWAEWYEAHALVGEATLARALGRYELAERHYRDLIAKHTRLPDNVSAAILRSELADAIAHQDRLTEAEVWAREALRLAETDLELALILQQLAGIFTAQGRFSDATRLLRGVIRLYERRCEAASSVNLARARVAFAETLVGEARWREAIEQFESVERLMRPSNPKHFEELFEHNLDWSLALLGEERWNEALAKLQGTTQQLESRFGATQYETAEARALLGIASGRTGDITGAVEALRAVYPTLAKRVRGGDRYAAGATRRDRRARWILEGFLDLLATSPGALPSEQGLARITFKLAELARGRRVQQALAASSARAATGNTELEQLARREQDARRRIDALLSRLAYQLSLPAENRDATAIRALRDGLAALEREHADLLEALEARFPTYYRLVSPPVPSVEEVRLLLDPDRALVATYTTDRHTFVWVLRRDGVLAQRISDLGRARLRQMVRPIRLAVEAVGPTIDSIQPFPVQGAFALYEAVLRPLEDHWQGASELVVVTQGELALLPLSVLPTSARGPGADREGRFSGLRNVEWLARTHALSSFPTVSAFQAATGVAPMPAERSPFIGFGDPLFALRDEAAVGAGGSAEPVAGSILARRTLAVRATPATRKAESAEISMLPPLPETSSELASIARSLGADPDRDLYLGVRASEAVVKAVDLSRRRVIAFATHGLVPGDLDGLDEPALALSSPRLTGESEDGLLTAGEILELQLNADWIVLSACNTAAAENEGAEAISGLGRAFFYAGAKALLVSSWPVESESARTLTSTLFALQAREPKLSRAKSLQRAMIHLVDEGVVRDDTGRAVYSYAHPLFWAPFTLVGDSGDG